VADFCTKLGVLEVNQFHCDSSFFRPILVVMVIKIGKFQQKIGYNSACK